VLTCVCARTVVCVCVKDCVSEWLGNKELHPTVMNAVPPCICLCAGGHVLREGHARARMCVYASLSLCVSAGIP
jgi:hypothetical protein